MKINNYIENFMNDYGIEVGEVFTDRLETTFFRIMKNIDGGYCIHKRDIYEGYFKYDDDGESFFGKLLSGNLEICRLPHRPFEGEEFYYCEQSYKYGEEFAAFRISKATFNSANFVHYMLWKNGNCFKTEMEARANAERVFDYIKDDKKNWRMCK